MCLSCGLENYSAAIFHLFTHAFFKALLFLICGVFIHSVMDEQKIYKLGGLNKVFPFSALLLEWTSMSLIGIPFYSGGLSKDFILRCSFSSLLWSDLFVVWISNFGILLTTLYSTKLIYCLHRSIFSKVLITNWAR